MNKGKGTRASEIKMIPVDRINILNPRARNQKVFQDIAINMTKVGLKRPITVTSCRSGVVDKDYDLICGQGRIEAFIACGQTHIPAIVIDADEEQALIMSLVENLARRQHRATDLLQGNEITVFQFFSRPVSPSRLTKLQRAAWVTKSPNLGQKHSHLTAPLSRNHIYSELRPTPKQIP